PRGHGERHAVELPRLPVALRQVVECDGAAGRWRRLRQRISLFHFSVHCGRCLATCVQSNRISRSTSVGPLMLLFATSGGTLTVLFVGLQNSSVANASCTSGEM